MYNEYNSTRKVIVFFFFFDSLNELGIYSTIKQCMQVYFDNITSKQGYADMSKFFNDHRSKEQIKQSVIPATDEIKKLYSKKYPKKRKI